MEPSPRAETSNLHFLFAFLPCSSFNPRSYARDDLRRRLSKLPSNSPVLIRVRRLRDKLFTEDWEYAEQRLGGEEGRHRAGARARSLGQRANSYIGDAK